VIAIENAFAKLKALLRKAAERTVDGPWTAIGRLVDLFTAAECRNYFAAAGYDATGSAIALEAGDACLGPRLVEKGGPRKIGALFGNLRHRRGDASRPSDPAEARRRLF
jgi:hypothetical protein